MAYVDPKESEYLAQQIKRFEAQEMAPEDFQRFRLENGVYGIRGTTENHMIRVKIPLGFVDSDQMDAMADAAEKYTPGKIGHVTTRQDIQFHNIKRSDVPEFLRIIGKTDLTTREACGNTVRNVTACPYAGISPTEAFDVTPYAKVVVDFFLRNPLNQNMPRKFKIAFEGCPEDHARTPIHDLGIVAAVQEQNGKKLRGFKMYVGGGLGTYQRSAKLLEPFTPAEWLLPTAEAIIRVYDRLGERKDRNRARIKFLVDKLGLEEFRRIVLAERVSVLVTRPPHAVREFKLEDEKPPAGLGPFSKEGETDKEFLHWKKTNAFEQKQKDYYAAHVRCPLGDMTVAQFRALAKIARKHCGGRLMTTIAQNMLLRWVPEAALSSLHQELIKAGLAFAGAERFIDITRCPGADTCNIAVTKSRGLAAAIGELFENGLKDVSDLGETFIKISGCPNSCGQHHIATLGFYGGSKNLNGHPVPHYQMLIGGTTKEGEALFGKPVMRLPSRRVPQAVEKVIKIYRAQRQDNEKLAEYLLRIGVEKLQQELNEFTEIPPYEQDPKMYRDWTDEEEFKLKVGKGECAV